MDEALGSVAEIARAIRDRRLSCEEVAARFLERSCEADERLRVFIEIEGDAALAQARAHDARLASGSRSDAPLLGVPFAAKDIFVRADASPPTAGARDVALALRARGAPVLDRLAHAGAIGLGRLNLDPFGYAATGANPDFGDARNPWNPAHVAGGSSGGAAAGVAAGALPFAIGSDTGGSARIPAAYCGVTGLKPTLGRVPKRGAVPLSYSQDTVGILARSVVDVAAVLDVVAGHDPLDPTSFDAPVAAYAEAVAPARRRLEGVRLGVDRAHVRRIASADVCAAIDAAIAVFSDLGAVIVDIDLGALAGYDAAATVMTWAEVGAVHTTTFRQHGDAYAPAVRARLQAALLSHGADHVNAMRFQGRALGQFLRGALASADVIATATTATTAPELGAAHAPDVDAAVRASSQALALNRPFNFLGVPAMSLPAGSDGRGLPIGLQIVTRPWNESQLLSCGAAYQTVTHWHRRTPPATGNGAIQQENHEPPD